MGMLVDAIAVPFTLRVYDENGIHQKIDFESSGGRGTKWRDFS